MKPIAAAGAAILMLVCSAGAAWSDDNAGPAWLNGVSGVKLIAVDGSSILLTPSDDTLTLTMASSAGAEQKTVFVLMTGNMGTVTDGDPSHVIGFFRVTADGLDAQFSDGRAETLMLNGQGGLSLSKDATCSSWYPAGHVFSEAERRAAVADYASRLGLAQMVSAKAPRGEACTQKAATPAVHPTQAMSLAPIVVRSSVVHAIDAAATSTVPMAPPPPTPVPTAAWSKAAHDDNKTADIVPAPKAGHGASDCLNVESDGANLGFRNSCGYGVQFVYCLQTNAETDASCDAGTKAGAVPANGFTTVVFDANIRPADAEHDFRWVACSGGASEVTPHLDHADPPAGRCVLTKSS